MKKSLAALLAATAVLGVTTAFAANPFSDVEPSHWAYQAVAQLANQGVVDGYPDGTFKGERNITRYEMAQMVARAMAKQNRVDAEQNAMINRLADEFSDELNSLGVRVSNLENRVGNVKLDGDVMVGYEHQKDEDDVWEYEAHVGFNAAISDNTKGRVRLALKNEFGNDDIELKVDRAYLSHSFGDKLHVDFGRTDFFLGQGLVYDDAIDGATVTWADNNFTLSGTYGRLNYEDFDIENQEMSAIQANVYALDKAALSGFYAKNNKGEKNELYGFGVNTMIDNIWIGGEWVTAKGVDNSDAWVAGVGYGKFDQKDKGSWDVKLQYFKEDMFSPVMKSTWKQTDGYDYKGWLATVDYALAENLGLNVYYNFNGKSFDGEIKVDDKYRVELNYQF